MKMGHLVSEKYQLLDRRKPKPMFEYSEVILALSLLYIV
jgi:hypothetical protein